MNVALVKIDVAVFHLGSDLTRINNLVDGGSTSQPGLLWVFNFSRNANGRNRNLRFWRPEVLERAGGKAAACHKLELCQVIDQILPATRKCFRAGEVDQLFQVRPRTRIDFGGELAGRLDQGSNVYSRASLASFLKRRWLGACQGKALSA